MLAGMTPRQKLVIAHIKEHGPITTLGILRAGLDPRAANNLLADGKLEIGERGYEMPKVPVPTECRCGCGGFPNAKHEAAALAAFWDKWWEAPSNWIRS